MDNTHVQTISFVLFVKITGLTITTIFAVEFMVLIISLLGHVSAMPLPSAAIIVPSIAY